MGRDGLVPEALRVSGFLPTEAMRRTLMTLRAGLVVGTACIALAACGGSDKEPTGQVVATVFGEEITAIDLRNEMGNFRAPDAATRKAAERAALEQIVQRKLLAHAAEEAKIDKSPEYAQQKIRADEAFLVRFWQDRVAKSVPPPSKDEIARFISTNPDLYAQRKVFTLDQIRTPMVRDPGLIEELKPLKSLPEIAALLTTRGLRYQEGTAQLDTLAVPPEVVAQILKLPPGEVFVVPQGNVMTINHIRATQVVPVPPEVTNQHATQYLLAQRTRQAVQRELGAALAAVRKEEDAVKYAKAYQPAPAPKAAAAPAKK